MPVEIKELIVRAVVADRESEGQVEQQASSGAEERRAIVEDCVRQVLRVLRKGKER